MNKSIVHRATRSCTHAQETYASCRRAGLCVLLSLAAVLLTRTAAADTRLAAPEPPRKLLFIGDSFTNAQGGIYTHLLKLVQSDTASVPITTDHVTVGGATLKRLWELGDAVRAIDTDSYDIVVLQDDIPEINVDYFREYAHKFVEEARRHHARPVLYMTWAYGRLGWISMSQIADAHRAVSKDLNVDVAPVGIAWERAHRKRPDLDLFAADREHPSPYGMYLATCVMYATIYNKDPTGLPYSPPELTPQEAAFLQKVAWQTVRSRWRPQHGE